MSSVRSQVKEWKDMYGEFSQIKMFYLNLKNNKTHYLNFELIMYMSCECMHIQLIFLS